eukprot:1697902-Pyramimonas_sp.AAC.1
MKGKCVLTLQEVYGSVALPHTWIDTRPFPCIVLLSAFPSAVGDNAMGGVDTSVTLPSPMETEQPQPHQLPCFAHVELAPGRVELPAIPRVVMRATA